MNDISINQENFSQNVEGFEDVKQCWKNILYNIPGTFPLLPTFGCDLWQYIDKPTSDSFGKARNVIIAALEKWEPRVKINKVTRTVNESQLLINIMGMTKTGEEINSQVDLSEIIPTPPDPTPTGDNYIFIGYVDSINPPENIVKSLISRIEDTANQSFVYTVDFKRFCFARRSTLGDLSSIKDTNGFEIISAFNKTTSNFTIEGQLVRYTIYTLIRPASVIDFTVTYIS